MAEEQVRIDTLPTKLFDAARESGATETIAKSAIEDETPPKVTGEESAKEFNEKRDEQQGRHKGGGFQKKLDRLVKERAELRQQLAHYEAAYSNGAESQEQSRESESNSGQSEQRSAPAVEEPRFQALRQRYGDFDRVMERAQKEGMRIHDDAVVKVLHSLEYKDDIAYQLASNDQVRNDFLKLPPAEQIERIRGANAEHSKFFRAQPFLEQIKQTFSPEEIAEVVQAEGKNQVGASLALRMAQELHELPNGPDVWRHIVKDTEISKRLNQMSPSQRTLELGRISARLEGNRPRFVSKAPAPINPVGGGGSKSTVPLDRADMKTYNAARDAGRVR